MKRRLTYMGIVLLLVVSTSGCGGEGTGSESDTPTTGPVPPATATSTSLPGGQSAADTDPFPAGEPIDLVYIADSGKWNVDQRYADLASEALGREVRLNTTVPADPGALRTTFAESVAEAEIIVFYFGSADFARYMPEPNFEAGCIAALDAVEDPDYSGPPWTPGTKWDPVPVIPTTEDWQPYEDWLGEVYDAIWEAREGRPVVLRAHDIYNPWLAPWTEVGLESECTAIWEGQNQAIQRAAESRGAVFVSFFDLFNGPGHDQDPRARGWIDTDGMHANEAGGAAAADALAAVGFALSEPPGGS